jgi:NAD-dependent oxidoreductase involved in siderophore biosynthesis
LEPPKSSYPTVTEEALLAARDRDAALGLLAELLVQEMGLGEAAGSGKVPAVRGLYPDSAQIAVGPRGIVVADRLCPVDPDARTHIYDRVEEVIED